MSGPEDQDGEKETDRPDLEGMSPLARAYVEAAPYLNIGWVFVASIGVFALLGWWLDKKLGTDQLGLTIGAIFGIVVGFVNFFKVVVGFGKRKER